MYPDSTTAKLSRSISVQPTFHTTQSVMQRSVSVPGNVNSSLFSLLSNAKAVLQTFVKIYPTVWNVYLPDNTNIVIQLSDAVSLLPQLSTLLANHQLKRDDLGFILSILTQMMESLPFTIRANVVQHALQDHGQVGDLLHRAEKYIRDTTALLNARFSDDPNGGQTESLNINSARAILAAAVVVQGYLGKVLKQNIY